MTHVARSSLIIAFFFGIDKVFGFARQILVARLFGLSYDIDVFNAANNIPDLLSALISGGALGVALIPVISEYLGNRGRRDAWLLFARILNLAFLVTGLFAILIAVFARPLVTYVIVPGFPAEQQALTVELLRLDLVAIMIFSLSGLVMAGLQANQHFVLPAMAPVLYNVGQLFGLLVLSPKDPIQLGPVVFPAFGMGIHGLVYGVILGAGLHLAVQVPGLMRYRFVWTPGLGINDPGVRKVLRLFGPRIATMFFIQMFFIIRDNLASGLGEGSVTALNYGWFIMQVPETLIGTALAIAVLPTLSELAARGDDEGFRDTLNQAIRVLFALTIPISVLLAAGVQPIVEILGFDETGTAMVVAATRTYLLGLAGHALLEIAARSFYARQNAWTPFFAAMLNALGYGAFAVMFSRLWGHVGIALANSLAFTLEALLLFWLLNRYIPGIFQIRKTVFRVAAGTILGGGVTIVLLNLLPLDNWSTVFRALAAAGAMGGGFLTVMTFTWSEVKLLLRI